MTTFFVSNLPSIENAHALSADDAEGAAEMWCSRFWGSEADHAVEFDLYVWGPGDLTPSRVLVDVVGEPVFNVRVTS